MGVSQNCEVSYLTGGDPRLLLAATAYAVWSGKATGYVRIYSFIEVPERYVEPGAV